MKINNLYRIILNENVTIQTITIYLNKRNKRKTKPGKNRLLALYLNREARAIHIKDFFDILLIKAVKNLTELSIRTNN